MSDRIDRNETRIWVKIAEILVIYFGRQDPV